MRERREGIDPIRRIVKNSVMLFISQWGSYLLIFLSMRYAARYFGPSDFGILFLGISFTRLFGIFTDLGLSTLMVREIARDKSSTLKYLVNGSWMKLLLTVFSLALIAIVVNLLGYPKQTIRVIYILSLVLIFNGFTRIFYSIFQAYERMEYQALGQTLNAIFIFIGIILSMKYLLSLIDFVFFYIGAAFITSMYSFWAIKLQFLKSVLTSANKPVKLNYAFCKTTIKKALPFGLTGIFIAIYFHIDTVMLSLMIPNSNKILGWYNAAYRLVLFLMTIPLLYVTAIFPVMSRFFKSSEKSLNYIFRRSIKYMLVMNVPIATGITLLADRIILIIFGPEYGPSKFALQILIWSFLFASIAGVFGYLLYAINRQTTLTKVVGCGMVLNVLLNWVLIPHYSYIGASIATDLTRFAVILIEFIILSNTRFSLLDTTFLKWVLKIILSTLVMAVFIVYFKNMGLFLLVILSALFYFITLYLLKLFDEEDLSLFRLLMCGTIKEN